MTEGPGRAMTVRDHVRGRALSALAGLHQRGLVWIPDVPRQAVTTRRAGWSRWAAATTRRGRWARRHDRGERGRGVRTCAQRRWRYYLEPPNGRLGNADQLRGCGTGQPTVGTIWCLGVR